MAANNQDEIDIKDIFHGIRKGFDNLLLAFYSFVRFLIGNWIILLLLIIIGFGIGYYLEKNSPQSKSSTLVVQINYDAANMVYNSIDKIQAKIGNKETAYLENNDLVKGDEVLIKSIEIEPIVDILNILEETEISDRNVEVLLEQSKIEEDLLLSEIFIPKYSMHKIKVETNASADSAVIEKVVEILNDNDLYNNIKQVVYENMEKQINHNEYSISLIDSILKFYGSPDMNLDSGGQVSINSFENNNGNIHLLLQEKEAIIEKNELLKAEKFKHQSVVTLLNEPFLVVESSILNKKSILIPISFVLIFLLVVYIRRQYKKGQSLYNQRNA